MGFGTTWHISKPDTDGNIITVSEDENVSFAFEVAADERQTVLFCPYEGRQYTAPAAAKCPWAWGDPCCFFLHRCTPVCGRGCVRWLPRQG